jgi:hypothetical protein
VIKDGVTWVCWSWDRLKWHAKGGNPEIWTDRIEDAGRMSWAVVSNVITKGLWPDDELTFQPTAEAETHGKPQFHPYGGKTWRLKTS